MLAALVVAQTTVLVLEPRDEIVSPAVVDARSYFSAVQIERADAYRHPNLALGLLATGLGIAALAAVAVSPPERLRTAGTRAPLRTGAVAGASLAVLTTVIALPVRAVLHERAVDVGLSTQTWGAWLGDVARGLGIGALFAAAGGLVAVALLRRWPRRWWIPAAAAVWLYGVVTIALGPLVLDPVYNRFEPLRGPLRADVVRLAERAGVDVGEVLVMDASRRTTAANAYVAGLGATKRVVLYDNLVEDFPRDEVRTVVAHELGHQRDRDLPGGLLFLALVAPAGLWAAAVWTRRMAPEGGAQALPALALAVTVISLGITWVSNDLSRKVEARADATALRLTRDPEAFIDFHRRLAIANVSDVDPPGWTVFLRTHPPTMERIGAAVSFRSPRRSAVPRRTPGGS